MAGTSVAPYQYPPRHRRSPRHPQTLSVLTVMLTGVTLIALLALGSLFVAPRPLVAEHRPHDLVPRFYAGANEILAGGSSSTLEDVAAPDLLDHLPGRPSGDRSALVQRLTDLRLAAPDARLRVSAFIEEGEWAAARVTSLGMPQAVHGIPLDPAPEPHIQTDFFRVIDDKIVEYWPGGSAMDLPQILPPITVGSGITDTTVSLARLTFPSGAALRDLDAPGEHLILVEDGELEIRLADPASRFEAAHSLAGWQVTSASEQNLILQAGDAVLIPPGTRHSIANVRAGAATMVGVAMLPAAAIATIERAELGDDPPLIAIYDPRRVNTRVAWDRDVSVDVLAVGTEAATSGPCASVVQHQLTVTRFTLGPRETIPVHQVEGIELLVINTGGINITPPDGMQLEMPMTDSGVRNAGPLPLGLIGVTLQPTGGTSCAVVPIES